MSAHLINMLLIRAGIHPNPGPIPGTAAFYCCVCQNLLSEKFNSVQCSKCKNWCHIRKDKTKDCSKLVNIRKYKPDFICPTCINNITTPQSPPTTPQQPTQPSTPVASGVQGPPTSTPAGGDGVTTRRHNIKILQFTCNGIRNKITEISKLISENNVMIAAFQETYQRSQF